MKHTGISTQYQKHVAKHLFTKIESGECSPGEKSRFAKTVVAQYMESDLHGEHKQSLLYGKDIRRELQNVYELLIVYTEIRRNTIELSEEDFDQIDASKLALLSPFISKSKYSTLLNSAVAIAKAKNGTAKKIRELKKSVI